MICKIHKWHSILSMSLVLSDSTSPQEETITYMREHFVYKNVQFQSDLSMLDQMYDDLDQG